MTKEQKKKSFIEIVWNFFADSDFNLFSSTLIRADKDTTQSPKSRDVIIKYSEETELISLDELKDLILSDSESISGSSELGYFGMIINEAIEGFELAKPFILSDDYRYVRGVLRKILINYHNFYNELLTIWEVDILEEREALINEFKEKVNQERADSNLEILTAFFVKMVRE
jgi:hypothetical protein